MRVFRQSKRLLRDRSAATAIEYGLVAAGIALVIVTCVNTLGSNLSASYNNVANIVSGGDDGGGLMCDDGVNPPAPC